MKTRPATEYALLGALVEGPKHGYEILQFLARSLGSTWYVSTSQLYTLLKRLEREGLVTSTLTPQERRPSKRVFSLTSKGKKAFEKWLVSPSEHVRDLRIEFLAKMFFIHSHSRNVGHDLIDKQIHVLKENRKKIISKGKKEENSYEALVSRFKLMTIDAWLNWLENEAKDFVGAINKR